MEPNPALIPGSNASEYFMADGKYYCITSGITESTVPGTKSFENAYTLLLKHSHKERIFKAANDSETRVFLFIKNYLSCFNYTPDVVDMELCDEDGKVRCQVGDAKISTREREIIVKIADGNADKEIAKKLFISPHTVSTTIRNLRMKLHATSKFHIIAKAAKAGVL